MVEVATFDVEDLLLLHWLSFFFFFFWRVRFVSVGHIVVGFDTILIATSNLQFAGECRSHGAFPLFLDRLSGDRICLLFIARKLLGLFLLLGLNFINLV